ncbi:MAG: LpxL/LpxP family Kdo(2)-lipid IV(A) lauroyl/palmitoleoyl acyltransferase [Gammaproteobacteria bacterium]|nr:LpxL/LpxP family Kdo(2)-lipid IV(A) lauroyl/palmitoleoyl acyltransferase [Gammaproteobacteria bacterium]
MNRDASGEFVRLRRFVGPRYWPIWVFLWLARGIAWLPFSWQIRIGAGIGHLSYFLARRRRGICEVNLRLCFPDLDSGGLNRLVRRTFVSNGIGLMEVGISWYRDPEDFRSRVSIEGLEHLREAVARGRGVLLVAAHFTTLEIGGFLLSLFHPMAATYRAHENPLFDGVMFNRRRLRHPRIIERRDVRGMLRCLREGFVVWYAPDQDYGPRRAVFVPFFGVKAATITATSRYAGSNGTPVLFFSHYRKADNSGYHLRISPELDNFPSGDEREDAIRINRLVEAAVREQPDQYLWLHRRFKTREAGDPSPYR